MLQYRCDDSFDNSYVDDNLRRIWREDAMEKLTPLRNWEQEDKYQVSNSAKLTKKELKRVLWLFAPTFAFILVTILFLGLDLSIARLIDVFARFYEVHTIYRRN